MKKRNILIVDDELNILNLLEEILSEEGYLVTKASNASEARKARKEKKFDLVLLDIWMPDTDGISLLSDWSQQGNLGPVIMMSGHATIDTAMEATRLGAIDFVEKPLSISKLLKVVEESLMLDFPKRGIKNYSLSLPFFVGKNTTIKNLGKKIKKLNLTGENVILSGEDGSGRHDIAKYLSSDLTRDKNIKIIDILAPLITSGEFDSLVNELSGNRIVLIIRGVDNISSEVSKKLSSILSSRNSIERVFSTISPFSLKNKTPYFSEIFSNLGIVIQVPPLRHYAEDIPELLKYYINYFVEKDNMTYREFTVAAQNRLINHLWPGNIGELKQLIYKSLLLGSKENISLKQIEDDLDIFSKNSDMLGDDLFSLSMKDAKIVFERYFLSQQLALCDGKVSKLASKIGVERTHLYRKLKNLNIDYREAFKG